MSHAMQPAGQGSVFAKRADAPGKNEKRGLEGILGVLRMLQDPPADAINHWTVAADDCLERRLVTAGQRPFDKPAIRMLTQRLGRHSPCQAAQEFAQL